MKPNSHLQTLWLRLTRAEYWWQPLQLWRRALRFRQLRRRMPAVVRPAWGLPIGIDSAESSGRSILALNVLDLPVTEAIWRLLDDHEVCADIGANIGCMTGVMAARLRAGGCIWAFEPVPELAERLRHNVARWPGLSRALIHVREIAVADRDGPGELNLPDNFAVNRDTANLAAPTGDPGGRRIRVNCGSLDRIFATGPIPHLLKIDVEGGEANVLRGAHHLLSPGGIRDLIFEELRPPPAESISILQAHGYAVFRIARGWLRPRLVPVATPLGHEIDLPSYLATRDSPRAMARFRKPGWLVLRHPRP